MISANDSIENACAILVSNGISSAPVVDSDDSGNRTYIGMFDFRDLVDYVLLVEQQLSSIPENEEGIKFVVSTANSVKKSTARVASGTTLLNVFLSFAFAKTFSTYRSLQEKSIYICGCKCIAVGCFGSLGEAWSSSSECH